MPRESPLTDEEIVPRILEGERALFEVLMRRHNRKVFRAVRSIVTSNEEAEDVMQAAYVAAFEHLASFAGRAAVSTWITRIAVHEALARVQRDRRFTATDEDTEMPLPPQKNPESRASDGELRSMLEDAIDALPMLYRTVFMLRSVEELSVAEVAETLEVPEDTVKTRHHRARAMLQEALLARAAAKTPEAFGFHLDRCDRIVNGVFATLGAAK